MLCQTKVFHPTMFRQMKFLRMVKEKQTAYDNIFEPLQDIIDVLTTYNVEIPEKSIEQLQELPERWIDLIPLLLLPIRWGNTKRLAVTAKQKVAPMQGQEVKKLTERIEDYDLRQREARAKYQGMRWDRHSSILLSFVYILMSKKAATNKRVSDKHDLNHKNSIC